MWINACFISDTGKVREKNEDSLLVNDTLVFEAVMQGAECRSDDGEIQVFVVADGMGGHRKGEVASRTVLDLFRLKYSEIEDENQVRDVVRLAKERLNLIAEAERSSFGLATTISGIWVKGERAVVFNCGDSRVYRMGKSRPERLTKDHSLVQELADAGVITEEEMRSHPRKNIVTSSLMGDLSHVLPRVNLQEIEIEKGERFLVCTDGVWESMSSAGLGDCFSAEKLHDVVDCLFRKAIESGARDNLTMIVLEIV